MCMSECVWVWVYIYIYIYMGVCGEFWLSLKLLSRRLDLTKSFTLIFQQLVFTWLADYFLSSAENKSSVNSICNQLIRKLWKCQKTKSVYLFSLISFLFSSTSIFFYPCSLEHTSNRFQYEPNSQILWVYYQRLVHKIGELKLKLKLFFFLF